MSAQLYLPLHDDGPDVAETSPGRRLAALLFATLLLAGMPLVLFADTALAAPSGKVSLAADDDDDRDDDTRDDDTRDTATNSRSATVTGDTGASTRNATATASASATNTANTGVSTKPETATASASATNTGKTGVSTR